METYPVSAHSWRVSFLGGKEGNVGTVFSSPGESAILIDPGEDAGLPSELGPIGLLIFTDPQKENPSVLQSLVAHHRIGAILVNGRSPFPSVDRSIPVIAVGKDDRISFGRVSINILSPDGALAHSASLKETGLVLSIANPEMTVLLANTVDGAVRAGLLTHTQLLKADIFEGSDPIVADTAAPLIEISGTSASIPQTAGTQGIRAYQVKTGEIIEVLRNEKGFEVRAAKGA